jgi:hypothetical protein
MEGTSAVATPNFKILETFDDMSPAMGARGGIWASCGVDLNEAVIAAHPPLEGFMDF